MIKPQLEFLYFSSGNIKLAGESCHHDHLLNDSMAYTVSALKTAVTIIFGKENILLTIKAPRLLFLQITKMLP